MSISLAAVRTPRLNAPQSAPTVRYLTGETLAREIDRAVMAHPAGRRLPETERAALAATVAVTVWTRHARTLAGRTREDVTRNGATRTPADVLAWIDRADRMPFLAAREDGRVPVNGRYLRSVVASTLAQSAAWQDTADRYRTRAQSARAERGMVRAAGCAHDESDPLAIELAAQDARKAAQGADLDVAPADLADLAVAVAGALADVNGWTVPQTREVGAALVRAGALAADADVVLALADLAAQTGRTLAHVRVDASRGADRLRVAMDADPGALADLTRDTARAMGLTRADRWDVLALDKDARDARRAVDALLNAGGAWNADCLRTERSLPDWPDRERPAVSAPGSARAVLRYLTAAGL